MQSRHTDFFNNNFEKVLRKTSLRKAPSGLAEAVFYSLNAGGKRFRPMLCLEASAVLGVSTNVAMTIATAIECLHTYSLIHDDLPAMDNDDLRRGKPTSHKKFNEATAILAGDLLQTLSFEILCDSQLPPSLIQFFASRAGAGGMVSGQFLDMNPTKRSTQALHRLHRAKTGRLIEASIMLPAMLKIKSRKKLFAISRWALELGTLFQITDDILDETGETHDLGKSPGKDKEQNKMTFISCYGLDGSLTLAGKLSSKLTSKAKIIFSCSKIFQELPGALMSRKT